MRPERAVGLQTPARTAGVLGPVAVPAPLAYCFPLGKLSGSSDLLNLYFVISCSFSPFEAGVLCAWGVACFLLASCGFLWLPVPVCPSPKVPPWFPHHSPAAPALVLSPHSAAC